jgi:hypothetical protein
MNTKITIEKHLTVIKHFISWMFRDKSHTKTITVSFYT